jgi:hypothetical protein
MLAGLAAAGFAAGPGLRPDMAGPVERADPWTRAVHLARRVLTWRVALRHVDAPLTRLYRGGVHLLYTWPGQVAATANVHDSAFQPLVSRFAEEMIVLTDHGFVRKEGNPPNMKVCARGTWNDRMVVETLFSMLTTVCHCKKVLHRVWRYFTMRLALTVAAFNVLAQWDGLPLDDHGEAHLSIAQFSL